MPALSIVIGAAVDAADRGFGAGRHDEEGKEQQAAHSGSRKSDGITGRFTLTGSYMPTGRIDDRRSRDPI